MPLVLSCPSPYPPEDDEGDIEYKWKLLPASVSPERFTHLITQMRFRLHEGRGQCEYRIGVADDGSPKGLNATDYAETLEIIRRMAQEVGGEVEEVRRYGFPSPSRPAAAEDNSSAETLLFCGELRVTRSAAKEDTFPADARQREAAEAAGPGGIRTQIAVCGPPDAGKTTLVSVLLARGETEERTNGGPLLAAQAVFSCEMLDDGHGSARHRLLSHRHELETGRSSRAVARTWVPPPFPTKNSSPKSSCRAAPVALVDAGDGLTKSVLFTLLHRAPHVVCLCVSASSIVDAISFSVESALTPCDAHDPPIGTFLDLMWEFNVPLMVVVTKRDLVQDELEWEAALMEFTAAVETRCRGRWMAVELLETPLEEAGEGQLSASLESLLRRMESRELLPIVPVSCVTGDGLEELTRLLSAAATPLQDGLRRSPLHPPSPLFMPSLCPLALEDPPDDYFELLVDDFDARQMWAEARGAAASAPAQGDVHDGEELGVQGRIASGSISVGQTCILGPVSSGDFLRLGRVTELMANDCRAVRLNAKDFGAGEPVWVTVRLSPADPSDRTGREMLRDFIVRFKKNKRHPKGRVLLLEPPGLTRSLGAGKEGLEVLPIFPPVMHAAASLVAGVTWGFVVEMSNVSPLPLFLSCEPLVIARHTVQAVRLSAEGATGEEGEEAKATADLRVMPLLPPCGGSSVASCQGKVRVRCRFLFTPEMVWAGEPVCLQWPPRGLAVGRIVALMPTVTEE